MSEQLRRQTENQYSVQSPENDDRFSTTVSGFEQAHNLIEISKRRKYYQARRALNTAYSEGRINREKIQELRVALNKTSQAELSKDVVREPNWERYEPIDIIDWSADPDSVAQLAQLPNGNIVIFDEQTLDMSLWDEDLKVKLLQEDGLRATSVPIPLHDGRLIYDNLGQLRIFDPKAPSITELDEDGIILLTTDEFNAVYFTSAADINAVCRYDLTANTTDEESVVVHEHRLRKIHYDHGRIITLDAEDNLKITHLDKESENADSYPLAKDFSVGPNGDIYTITPSRDAINRINSEGRTDPTPLIPALQGRSGFEKVEASHDGQVLVVAVGSQLVLYSAVTGQLIKPLTRGLMRDYIVTDDDRVIVDSDYGELTILGEF